MSRAPVLAAVAAAAALTLTACSGGLGVFGGDEPTAAKPAAPAPVSPPGVYLSSNSTAQLGTTVIDAVGFTVYRSDKDTANPSKSACEGRCAETWKPMPYVEPVVVEGVDKASVGHITRTDGTEQVTLAGWPVYTLAGEQTGATTGHGKDGSWFAIKPDGKKAQKPT